MQNNLTPVVEKSASEINIDGDDDVVDMDETTVAEVEPNLS